MKFTTINLGLAFLLISAIGYGHDEGHGPKITDAGKHGGIVTAVVAAKDRELGPKAPLIYKAELLRMSDRSIRFFLYDKDMKPLALSKFKKVGKGLVETEKKKKVTEQAFELTLNENCSAKKPCFMGKIPEPKRKPYNIDIRISEDQQLLAAFDNLD